MTDSKEDYQPFSSYFARCYAGALIMSQGNAETDLPMDERIKLGTWVFKRLVLDGESKATFRGLDELAEILVKTRASMPGMAMEVAEKWANAAEKSPKGLEFKYHNGRYKSGNNWEESGCLRFITGTGPDGTGKFYILQDHPN